MQWLIGVWTAIFNHNRVTILSCTEFFFLCSNWGDYFLCNKRNTKNKIEIRSNYFCFRNKRREFYLLFQFFRFCFWIFPEFETRKSIISQFRIRRDGNEVSNFLFRQSRFFHDYLHKFLLKFHKQTRK